MKLNQRNHCLMLSIVLICFFAPKLSADSIPRSVRDFAELAGCWAKRSQNGWRIEIWTPPSNDLMMGVSHSVRNDTTREYEFLQIRKKDNEIFYVAFPSGQKEAWFKLTSAKNRNWIFENPEHDFPQRISYELENSSILKATIEGNIGGELKSIDFSVSRIPCGSGDALENVLPSLREQARIQQTWLQARLDRILPALMREHGVAMWLVICREYNEDPVFDSLVSAITFAARRRTVYVFHDRGPEQGVERLALGGGSMGGLYQVYRDPEMEGRELWGEGQWVLLRKLIEERNPATIAVNISDTHAFSDGLSAGEYEALQEALGESWRRRIVRAELLPLEFIEIRIPEMLPVYTQMMQMVHSLISQAFSSDVIQPGTTTNQDVVWWLRQQVHAMGMDVWFHPSVHVQRKGASGVQFLAEDKEIVIQRGDVLHTDFGISAMGLNTDTQHMGYVLKEGETDVPEGIKKALSATNRLQDLLIDRMKPGKTGNEVLLETLEAMEREAIKGSVYTHPIGDHGHGAGSLIGLWDRQKPIPGRGDVRLKNNTWFSIELSAETSVPEWDNELLWVGQEEDAQMSDGKMMWIVPRQTTYHIIR